MKYTQIADKLNTNPLIVKNFLGGKERTGLTSEQLLRLLELYQQELERVKRLVIAKLEQRKDVDHILKLKQDRVISKSLGQTIYVTNSSPNDVYAAFDSESRGLIEAKESGCYTTKITLYKGERI